MIKTLKKLIDISIFQYIGKEAKCFILLLVYTAASLAFPTFITLIIDQRINSNNFDLTLIYSLGMLVTGVISVIFQYWQQISFYKLGQELVISIKQRVYKTLLRSNTKFWMKNSVGDVLIILGEDVTVLEHLLTSTISNSLVNLFVILGISIFILITDWQCGVLVLSLAVLFATMQKKIGPVIERTMLELRNSIGNLGTFTNETLQNANELQASGFETIMCEKYKLLNKNVIISTMKQIKSVAVAQSFGAFFNVLGLLVVIAFGAYQTISGNMTVGTLFALTVYVQRLYGPIVSLGNAYIEIKNSLPKINKIIDVLETSDVINTGTYCTEIEAYNVISFNKVDFSYEEKLILSNFVLEVERNEIVGITGKNGIGKSTILRLILSLCVPDQGEILLNNKDIMEYDNEFIRNKIGYVGQVGVMVSGKLKDILDPKNISSELEIKKLMKEFELDIGRFEQDLETDVDENHRNLSGGEFQKISLVRAFIENKDIYLLDEPTSAIDEKSEKTICEVIKEKLRGKTAIIITHRPKILEICDRILEMSDQKQ